MSIAAARSPPLFAHRRRFPRWCPIPHDGHLIADGGVLDNLPVEVFADDPSNGMIITKWLAERHGTLRKRARRVPHNVTRPQFRARRVGLVTVLAP